MKFKSVNEIEKFSFEDCVINKFEVRNDMICLELEALIVKPDNSQNTNYTESYAGTTEVRLMGGNIISAVKEGFRYYNADDVLISEKPDEPLTETQIQEVTKASEGAYLFSMVKKGETDGRYVYTVGIEFVDEEELNTVADSYLLEVAFEKAVFAWDFYMNRVQR